MLSSNLSTAYLIFLLPLLLLPFIYIKFPLRLKDTMVKGLPSPSCAHWFWGHEKIIFSREPGRAFRQWINELGLVFRIKAALGAPDILVLSDPDSIGYILREKIYDYHHSEVVRPRVGRLLGRSLGWIEGEVEHRRMRQLLSPMFSPQNIKGMSQDLGGAALRVLDDLSDHLQEQDIKQPVDILHWMNRVTLNVIGRVAFLHDFDGGHDEDAKKVLSARHRGASTIGTYIGFLTLMLLRRFTVLNKVPIFAIQAQGLAKVTIQSGVAREMVRRSSVVTAEQTTMGSYKDLLSILLQAHSEGELPYAEMLDHISTFMIAGQETTSHTLSFTVWQLSRHPEVQKRLREEVNVLPKDATYDDYQSRLPFMEAVLRETLRLFPGLPYMERVATKADTIPLGEPVTLANGTSVSEIFVTAGQVVIIPIIDIHRLDSIWSNADEFCPQRWLKDPPSPEKLCKGWSNLLAFSDGPRSCIGTRLATFQYKVVLTELLRRFEFLDSGASVTLKVASSLQPWDAGRPQPGPSLPVILAPL